MNPRKHLEVARALVTTVRGRTPLIPGPGEAECRCAIGRAYYAAFLVAREFLNRIGVWVTPTALGHTAVQFALNNSGGLMLNMIATQLESLSTNRIFADYEPNDPRTETLHAADSAVGTATTAIQMLDIIAAGRATPSVDLAAVAGAILEWARANGQEGKLRRL